MALTGSPSALISGGLGSWGSPSLMLTRGRGAEAETPPTPIDTTYIIAMATYRQPLGDFIVYEKDDGSIVVAKGYGPPAGITPDSTLVVSLYTYQLISGPAIVQEEGSGALKVRKGIS